MAHPTRPYEDTGSASWGGTAGSSATHPPRPYGTSTSNPATADTIGHGKVGQKTQIGPMPTRNPEMTGEP